VPQRDRLGSGNAHRSGGILVVQTARKGHYPHTSRHVFDFTGWEGQLRAAAPAAPRRYRAEGSSRRLGPAAGG
jgi:hypothetical protein